VLDPDSPPLAGNGVETLLDAFVFAGNANPVRHVYVGGRQVIAGGRHAGEAQILAAFRRTLGRLAG
jgi:formimidoylglutamate deiminase